MLAFKGVIKNEKNVRRFNMLMLLLVVFITLIWMPLSLNRLNKIAQNVEASIPKREIAFAVSAIWSGKHLPEKACVAADDLGAIGFFARPDIKVVDIYGILRTPQDKHLDRIDILKREKPEAMFLRFKRLFGEEIESGLPGEYIWLKFGHLDLALRRDIAQKLLPDENELIQIENELDLNREYKW